MEGLITDRSETQEEIDSKIDVSAQEFQKIEGLGENREEDNQFYEGDGDVQPWGGKAGSPHSEMLEDDDAERAERPKKKRMGNAETLRS